MRKRRNRYRNSLGISTLFCWVLIVVVLGITASSYVYIKNQYVTKSDRKRDYEDEIKQLEREIESIELKLASMMDRVAIQRMLQNTESKLQKIDPRIVEFIEADDLTTEYALGSGRVR